MQTFDTLAQYLAAIAARFVLDGATPHTVVTATDRLGFLNEGRDEVAFELLSEFSWYSGNSTAGSAQTLTGISSGRIIHVDGVWFDGEELLSLRSRKEFQQALVDAETGTPTHYWVTEDCKTLYLIPTPAAVKVLKIATYLAPIALAVKVGGDDADLETNIPPIARKAAIYYALAQMYDRDGLNEQGKTRSQLFQQKFESAVVVAKTRMTRGRVRGKPQMIGFA